MIYIFVAWYLSLLAGHTQPLLDAETETLINKLPQVSQIGYGYSAMFSGSQFLPDSDATQVQTLVLGSQAPTNSPALEMIVRRGILAVPSLLKHLDDGRETRIQPLSGMMWMSFADEYDFNRRVRKDIPIGVNRDDHDENHPSSHTVTVGDLCFVALGQIVNRNFNATRYQPTGGLVVNSPTYSKQLCSVVRADFEGLTEKKHRELLVQDFVMPDSEERRIGACRRIAFYYPDALEPLVLNQLAVPTYDVFRVEYFVRDELYREKSKEKRKAMFDEFLRINGQAFSDGVLLQLFGDLDLQEADEQKRLSPPLKQKYDARALLVQLYGFTDGVDATNRPYVTTWNEAAESRFIEALTHVKNPKIDEAVNGIFLKISDDDYLALACMKRLMDREYEQEIRHYCERRITKSKDFTNELQHILTQLDSEKVTNTQPGIPAIRSQSIRSKTN